MTLAKPLIFDFFLCFKVNLKIELNGPIHGPTLLYVYGDACACGDNVPNAHAYVYACVCVHPNVHVCGHACACVHDDANDRGDDHVLLFLCVYGDASAHGDGHFYACDGDGDDDHVYDDAINVELFYAPIPNDHNEQ